MTSDISRVGLMLERSDTVYNVANDDHSCVHSLSFPWLCNTASSKATNAAPGPTFE